VSRRLRLLTTLVLPAVMTSLAAISGGAGAAPAHAFAMAECLATGAGLPSAPEGKPAWARRDAAARALACREAERAHRDRARWEAEHQVARDRARALETGARFRAERTRAGLEAPSPPARSSALAGPSLPPCPRPDATSECAATPEQILYQIERSRYQLERSRAAGGAPNGTEPAAR
jgi:hypothetical protein